MSGERMKKFLAAPLDVEASLYASEISQYHTPPSSHRRVTGSLKHRGGSTHATSSLHATPQPPCSPEIKGPWSISRVLGSSDGPGPLELTAGPAAQHAASPPALSSRSGEAKHTSGGSVRSGSTTVLVPRKVTAMASGSVSSAAILDDGSLYAWGWGEGNFDFVECDQPGARQRSPQREEPQAVRSVLAAGGQYAKCVAMGGCHMLVVTTAGQLWSCGRGEHGVHGHGDTEDRPVLRPPRALRNITIASVSASSGAIGHSTAVTDTGQLYTWGRGFHGQLGHGSTDSSSLPRRVEAFWGHAFWKVISADAGACHTCAVTDDGVVWTWGWGGKGQLGHGDTKSHAWPRSVIALQRHKVAQACAGDTLSAVVTATGDVWTWGANQYGRLGHESTKPNADGDEVAMLPVVVGGMEHRSIVQLAVGGCHFLAVTSDGTLFVWGWNYHGQCGVPASESVGVPRELTADLFGQRAIVHAGAGSCHSMVLTEEGFVWTAGNGSNGQLGRENRVVPQSDIPSSLKAFQSDVFEVVPGLQPELELSRFYARDQ